MSGGLDGVRVGYVLNSGSIFLSHFAQVATYAIRLGAEVTVVVPEDECSPAIHHAGFHLHHFRLSRLSRNPVAAANTVWKLRQIYRRRRLQLVHHITAKAVICGSVAARLAGDVAVVNSITGLGYAFAQPFRARLLRRGISTAYQIALRVSRGGLILENHDDLALFRALRIPGADTALVVPGTGVDCRRFSPAPFPGGMPTFAFVGRMIQDKGIIDFLKAASLVRDRQVSVRFVAIGRTDPGNPTTLSDAQLSESCAEAGVEYLGFHSDIATSLKLIQCIVLPSWREGFPRVIQEAAAAGLPAITTDVPGCREAIMNGRTGILVPPGNYHALADAITALAQNRATREQMGSAARALALTSFSVETVVPKIVAIYQRALSGQ